jgi:diguanylate cyclase (GGDEF)-like protein
VNLLMRERWPLLVGAGGSLLVLALFGLTDLGDRAAGWNWRPLGIAIDGWGFALLVLAVLLSVQLLLNARISLRRERRLVETAAALREANARLEQLRTTDTLTGLLTRGVFYERLGIEFRRSLRYSRPIALLMIDLDHFKLVNDEHGHPYGDFVLAETAAAIREALRESDIVGRYGGEEFVVMLPETERSAAWTVAEKLRVAVAARDLTHDGTAVQMTISVGVSALPAEGVRIETDLVARADEALYRAKREGRDRVVVADTVPAPADATPPER